MKRRGLMTAAAGMAAIGLATPFLRSPQNGQLSDAVFAARYGAPLAAPKTGLGVFHLGHSLVGRLMPYMVQQLTQSAQLTGHHYASQLGWGTSLAQHKTADASNPGFDLENDHSAFRPATQALASGEYDAVILTEMVEIRDAIKYHDSADNLAHWAQAAWRANPDARVYLYETWHELTDPEGWLARIKTDLPRYWEAAILRPAMDQIENGVIHVIPAGQAMAAVAIAAEAGQIDGLTRRQDLFALTPDGQQDPIHFNDIGAYVVALTHFSTLYHRSPKGLAHQLNRPDATPARALSNAAAAVVQDLVWSVVKNYPATGVAA